MSATNREPINPVDEELEQLLQHPEVTKRLDDFESRRRNGKLVDAASAAKARRLVGLPPRADRRSR